MIKDKNEKYQLLYDANCGFCSGIVNRINPSVRNSMVQFIDQNSKTGQSIIHNRLPHFDSDTVVLLSPRKIFFKSDAIIELCGLTQNGWRLLMISRIIPVRIRNWIYDRIARNRYWLFSAKSCKVIGE